MVSVRESALQALYTKLQEISGPVVVRNDVETEKIPSDGLINLIDGDPGEPEVTLSPTTYHYEHRAEIEVYVQGRHGRDSLLDILIESIEEKLMEDDSLGGMVEYCEPQAPSTEDISIEGAPGVKGAIIPVILCYSVGSDSGVSQTLFNVPIKTEAEMNAIPDPIEGTMVWNSTDCTLRIFDGTEWAMIVLGYPESLPTPLPPVGGGSILWNVTQKKLLVNDGSNWGVAVTGSIG